MNQPLYVKVSRNQQANKGGLSWTELCAEAETHTDGVEFGNPAMHFLNWPTRDEFHATNKDEAKRAEYDREYGSCYFYQGDVKSWGKDKAILFQQNW